MTHQTYVNKRMAGQEDWLPLTYICSPYSGDTRTNVQKAKRYSRFAMLEDVIPVTPHLLYPRFMDDKNPEEHEKAMRFDYVLLGKCEELWVFGGVITRGMQAEINLAKKRNMMIRWFNSECEEVPAYA